jgi:hypothetical protein
MVSAYVGNECECKDEEKINELDGFVMLHADIVLLCLQFGSLSVVVWCVSM